MYTSDASLPALVVAAINCVSEHSCDIRDGPVFKLACTWTLIWPFSDLRKQSPPLSPWTVPGCVWLESMCAVVMSLHVWSVSCEHCCSGSESCRSVLCREAGCFHTLRLWSWSFSLSDPVSNKVLASVPLWWWAYVIQFLILSWPHSYFCCISRSNVSTVTYKSPFDVSVSSQNHSE